MIRHPSLIIMLTMAAVLVAGAARAQEPAATVREPGAPTAPGEAREAIKAANERVGKAVERQDAKALSDLYTEDGAVLPPGGPFIQGRKQVETFWRDALTGGIRGATLETLETEDLGDTAWERGKATLTVQEGDGEPVTTEAKYIVIWKREPDGSWKLHRDIWNELAPAEAKSGP